MKVNVAWQNDDKKAIVYYTFQQGWGWQDVYEALDQAGDMIRTVSHRVDVIMDFREANVLPQSALSQIKRAYNNPKPENIGLTVLVTPNSFLNMLVSMAKKIWGENTRWELEFVKTLDDAYAIIELHRSKETPIKEEKNASG